MKRCVFLLFLAVLWSSCDTFLNQKKTSEEFLEEELKTITWDEVDTYPLFPDCDERESKTTQQRCFETTLHKHLNSFIKNQELVSNEVIDDTLLIQLSISKESEVVITEISGDSLTFETFPELQDQLYKSIASLPKIEPALKRGVPVNTMFVLPLVIKTE
ncbi:MAG: hypothetical protein WD530_06655 [Vicingaceae bacterium]